MVRHARFIASRPLFFRLERRGKKPAPPASFSISRSLIFFIQYTAMLALFTYRVGDFTPDPISFLAFSLSSSKSTAIFNLHPACKRAGGIKKSQNYEGIKLGWFTAGGRGGGVGRRASVRIHGFRELITFFSYIGAPKSIGPSSSIAHSSKGRKPESNKSRAGGNLANSHKSS